MPSSPIASRTRSGPSSRASSRPNSPSHSHRFPGLAPATGSGLGQSFLRQSLLLILVWAALFAIVCGLCLVALDDVLAGVSLGSIVMAGMAPVSRAFLS